uniref:C2 domain-containing protein n=1 Tax=Amphimedon queenslandica TaxID=400682 RepID=A0A1X7UPH4_AMPQE
MSEAYRLDVTVVSASSLPWVERDRGCDAMVKVKLEGQSKETKVVVGVNPVWNETLHFDLKKKPSNSSLIIIKVYDHEQIMKNKFLGSAELSFGSILSSDSVTCKIKDKNKEELKSTIKLYFKYISPSDEETLPTSMSREAPVLSSDTLEESERNEERHTPVSHLGIWSKNPWSDSTGKVKEDRDGFKLPPGWEWEDEWDRFIGDWEVMTSIDTGEYQTQRGSRKYEEKIYEYQSRMPFSNWPSDENESEWKNEEGHSLSYYTEDSRQVRDTLELPDGWEWDSEWSIAPPHRGTDKDGWEYKGLLLASGWAPRSRKSITRRRLWNRTRIQTGDAFIKTSTGDKYKGWEYAHISSSTYHQEHSPLFGKRRRRYLRKIKTKTQAKLSNPPRFIFPEHQQVQVPPRLYFPMKGLFKYELRVYLYQARDLYAGNSTGLSDPYCIVSFEHYSQTTREINQTLTPLWDHTCVFDDIKMFGSPSDVKGSPPKIMIEIFDKDNVGKDYLGYVECYPIVRINENQQQRRQVSLEETEEVLHVPFSLEGAEPVDEPKDPVTSLSWYQVTRYGRYAGQLLAAFELFLVDSVCPPPILERDYGETDKKKWWYTVPHGIRPEYETKTIKILCWGVRNLKKYRLGSVTSPFIKVECGGVTKKTNHIIDTRRNPNFTDGPIIMELKLPVNPLYCPPLNIYLYDKRAFGQKPLIGTYSVQITEDSPTETDRPSLRHNPLETANTLRQRKTKQGQVAIDMETFLDEDPDYIKDSRFDWWTKYRLAVLKATGSKLQDSEIEYVNENHDRLKLFHHELEKEPRFHNFSDVVKSYPLYRGKGSIAFDDPSENTRFAGTFKGHITVKRGKHTANEFDHKYIPTKDLCPVVIRVYVVEGIGLLPLDPNGKSDPYLRLSIGKCVMDDADNFVPNSLNPVFGKMFELSATLPLDHTLKIQVLDHDYGSRDDFIGQTEIDIENRFISRYRASCGIPETFSKNGPNHWRDTDLPTDILDWYCKVNGLKEPVRTANGLIYNYDEYTINHTDLKPYMRQHKYVGSPIQQIALALLRRENVLVHEHVETRTLENPNQPGISQGSLRMWVDIFPKSYNLPPPVDISPRKPEDYELRVIVYDVKDVKLADYNPVTDEEMSDIYVKGWLRGQEETQKTDVHYRSFDREGNFNYRFVFPFQYLPAEKRIVVSKRKFFDVNKTEIRALPYLTIQVWDNDKFKFDDHLGKSCT